MAKTQRGWIYSPQRSSKPSDRSPLVQVLTQTAKDLLGGYFIVEPDPKAAAAKLMAATKERRQEEERG
jgi:hydroxylamine reductase (hybrid-cluster protein)